ncbi:MAG: diguanylate cyclase [bacterium]
MPLSTETRSRTRHTPLSWATIGALAVGAVWATHVLRHISLAGLDYVAFAAASLSAGWLVKQWWIKRGDVDPALELQLGLSILVTSFVAADLPSAFGVDAFPLNYLVVALLVAFQSRLAGVATVVMGLTLLSVHTWFAPGALNTNEFVTRLAFLTVFGALALTIHGAEVIERRLRHRREVEEERERIKRQAREFRLLNATSESSLNEEQRLEMTTRDAVDSVNQAIYASMSLLKTGLGCHTVVLLWLDVRGEKLHIKELVSDSDLIIEGELDPARGVIGGITRRREPVVLDGIRPGFRGLSYYRESVDIGAFMGVPVVEGGHLRGVLCLDRKQNRGFDAKDTHVVNEAAQWIVRAIENERLFASIEKSRLELSRFFDASRRLNNVLTPREVFDVALQTAREMLPYDVAAITSYDPETDSHTVEAAVGTDAFEGFNAWSGKSFDANNGLVSMVIKNRHYLPYGGNLRDHDPIVFSEDRTIPGLKSMLVLPLIVQDQPIGTFIVGHSQAHRYTVERREMLEVVSNQVAVTLQNANLYARMEEMATTDGLTGLMNHRTFQARLDEAIARQRRTNKPFAVVLTDIDHFKKVNDTYGHPAGDEVLRQVANCFRDCLRETDIPARYGGEEFVIILEDTDLQGAVVIADRLRNEIKSWPLRRTRACSSARSRWGLVIGPRTPAPNKI